MLRRFYSKKSGFTLVEIIIAFAIFAIMASMIVQILNLSVSARRSNNVYQRELAEQERLLTLIKPTTKDFNKEVGTISFNLGGTDVSLGYDMLSAKADAENAAEGLNYFIANVNYQASGEISPGAQAGGGDSGASGTGSQAARMDTRLTGTAGLGSIAIMDVIKDTYPYAADDPYRVPDGYTRYFIRVAASSTEESPMTLKLEDIPYAQFRMYFYDDTQLNGSASSVVYTDTSGNKYKKNVPATAVISKVGMLSERAPTVAANGLSSSYITTDLSDDFNPYLVEQMGENCVRIGTPYKNGGGDGLGGKGVKLGKASNFYIEFKKINGKDVELTQNSFGAYSKESAGNVYYMNCPEYEEDYDDDGNPEYPSKTEIEKMNKHVNIYGAYLYTRNYNVKTTTPAPAEGGDEE